MIGLWFNWLMATGGENETDGLKVMVWFRDLLCGSLSIMSIFFSFFLLFNLSTLVMMFRFLISFSFCSGCMEV